MKNLGINSFEDRMLNVVDNRSETNPEESYENSFRLRIPENIFNLAKNQYDTFESLSGEALARWKKEKADSYEYINKAIELTERMSMEEIFKMLDDLEKNDPLLERFDKYRLAAFCDVAAGTNQTKH